MAQPNQPQAQVPFAINVEPLKHTQAVRINAQCAGVLSSHIVVPLTAIAQLKSALDRASEQVPRVQLTGANPEAQPARAGDNGKG